PENRSPHKRMAKPILMPSYRQRVNRYLQCFLATKRDLQDLGCGYFASFHRITSPVCRLKRQVEHREGLLATVYRLVVNREYFCGVQMCRRTKYSALVIEVFGVES